MLTLFWDKSVINKVSRQAPPLSCKNTPLRCNWSARRRHCDLPPRLGAVGSVRSRSSPAGTNHCGSAEGEQEEATTGRSCRKEAGWSRGEQAGDASWELEQRTTSERSPDPERATHWSTEKMRRPDCLEMDKVHRQKFLFCSFPLISVSIGGVNVFFCCMIIFPNLHHNSQQFGKKTQLILTH